MGVIAGTQIIYTVSPGDTLYSIAKRFNSSVQAIERANAVGPPFTDPGMIFPGQVLVIQGGASAPDQRLYVIPPGDTLYSIAQRFSSFPDLLAGINPQVQDPHFIFPNQQIMVPALIYEVEESDSLYRISTRFGVSISQILRANHDRYGISADLIYPGYYVIIPLPTSPNIAVFEPKPGERVESRFHVEGVARSFEANVLHQVRDDHDVIVSEERFTTASIGAPAYGHFQTTVPFDRSPTSPSGEVWVYTRSAKDGSIQDLVQVKVHF